MYIEQEVEGIVSECDYSLGFAMDRVLCPPQISYGETLIPDVRVLGGEAPGRQSGQECGALMHGISTLGSKAPESSPLLLYENTAISELQDGSLPGIESTRAMILNFSACKLRNKCLLLVNYSVFSIFVTADQADKDGSWIMLG